jgi:hypothetical protein
VAFNIARTLAVTAAGAGLALSLVAPAQAAGGSYSVKLANGCGSASGTYHWYATGVYDGKQAYKTDWDFNLRDLCSTNGRAVSLYTKYTKWNGSSWVSDGKYHKIASAGNGSNVADVRIFLCEVGYPSTCVSI